jgi:hypothetical protein
LRFAAAGAYVGGMFEEAANTLVWILRLALVTGIGWGAWLCIDELLLQARPEKLPGLERFATFALVVLLLVSTLGGFLPSG